MKEVWHREVGLCLTKYKILNFIFFFIPEIFKIASEEWKNCPEDKKRRLNQTALAEKSVYLAEKEKYNDSLTVEQRIELANAKKEAKLLAERKEKKEQTKQKQKELGIVRPKSAFLSFIQDERRNYETLNKEVISVIAQKWHKLPENVKSKYTSKFETEYAIYKDKLQEWKKLNEE